MKNIKRILTNTLLKLTVILLALSSLHASAQKPAQKPAQKTPFELNVYGGGGFSFYAASIAGTFSIGGNATVGGGFTAFLHPQVGLHLGVGFGLDNTKFRVDKVKSIRPGIDPININPIINKPYEILLHTTLIGYTETHKTMFLSIPLMFQFQQKDNPEAWDWQKAKKARFYAAVGVKALAVISHKYDVSVEKLNNLAYYPEFDNWAGTQTFAGLGDFDGNSGPSGSIGFNVVAMIAFEAGIKWRLREKLLLYTGVYFDGGLVDPTQGFRNPPGNYYYADHLPNLTLLRVANSVNLMQIGVRARVAFAKPKKEPCPHEMVKNKKIKK